MAYAESDLIDAQNLIAAQAGFLAGYGMTLVGRSVLFRPDQDPNAGLQFLSPGGTNLLSLSYEVDADGFDQIYWSITPRDGEMAARGDILGHLGIEDAETEFVRRPGTDRPVFVQRAMEALARIADRYLKPILTGQAAVEVPRNWRGLK